MPDPAVALLVGVLVLQVPIAVLVSFDAKRLDLEEPAQYYYAIAMPAAGFLVALYYVANRRDLPRRESDPADAS